MRKKNKNIDNHAAITLDLVFRKFKNVLSLFILTSFIDKDKTTYNVYIEKSTKRRHKSINSPFFTSKET